MEMLNPQSSSPSTRSAASTPLLFFILITPGDFIRQCGKSRSERQNAISGVLAEHLTNTSNNETDRGKHKEIQNVIL